MSVEIDLERLRDTINPSFWRILSKKHRYLILRGGGGSGKSYSIAQKIILRCLFASQKGIKHKILCMRKTNPDVRRSVFALLKFYVYEWNLQSLVKINRTDMTFTWKNGSEILCTGLDEPEKLKSIFGLTSAWLEEATEFTKDDFTQLDLRLRGHHSDYFQIMFSFNPISKTNWIYSEFFENGEREDTYYHHSTYRDNLFIDDQYIKLLQNYEQKSTYHYRVYALGEWGVLSGLIYDRWEYVKEMPKGIPLFGVDFGFNHPTAIVEVKRNKDDLYLREIFYKSGFTNMQLINWIKKSKQIKPSNFLICDAAEPARIKEMRLNGLKAVAARKGQNSIFDGIDYCKRLNIKIVEGSSNLVKEISGYQWKLDRKGEPLDEPVQVDDHACDAFRYPVFTKWGYAASKLEIVWV